MTKLKRTLLVPILAAALTGPALAKSDDLGQLADKAKISPARAIQVARTRVKSEVEEIELKAWEGKPVYKVEFRNDQKVYVDAITGQLIDKKPERKEPR